MDELHYLYTAARKVMTLKSVRISWACR